MGLVILLHFFLAISLFFGLNFLGQHTPSNLGYYQLTTFLEVDEAPAFNFVIRVLTPIIFIILISTLLYSLNLDRFTKDIYLVNVYYVSFRAIFNILIQRKELINWSRYFLYSFTIIGFSYLVYHKLIITKSNLLPDVNNLANELWIIIIIFLYNFINSIQTSDKNAQKRKEKYIKSQFAVINKQYSPIIRKLTNSVRLRQIALAIIIYENFNRPKLFRIVEYMNHFLNRKPHTLGIMQVTTTKFISDKESVRLGTEKLLKDFETMKIEYLSEEIHVDNKDYYDGFYQSKLIEMYNPDITYSYEILELANEINTKYFNDGPKKLFDV